MRTAVGIFGLLALALAGCAEAPPQPDPQIESAETILFHGGIKVEEENVTQHDDGSCTTSLAFLSKHLENLEGSQVIIRGGDDQIVATPTVEMYFSDGGCAWIFEEEIEQQGDFYRAEFLDMTTEVVSVSDAEDGVITFDIQTPIAERIESDAHESWDISPLDSFPG